MKQMLPINSQQDLLRSLEPLEQQLFQQRMELHWQDAKRPLTLLYANHPHFNQWLEKFHQIAAHAYANRPADLRLLDLQRLNQPDWFQQSDMVGYVAYADRFADDLNGVAGKIPYLDELGVNYLHLMPLLQPRDGQNDGGYAVMDYRQVRPDLGTMADLSNLATQLRQNDISLCIDLVCNHTAKEHAWAKKALAGDSNYQNYYHIFPDRTLPDQYEQTVREIFPDFKSGSFTHYEAIDKWVWTTFNEFQWDLNYANPAVFGEMLEIMLYLANQGVEVLRLDAVAFMWKRMGTDCENQPEAHAILQAFRALSRIAAPALLLKAEAIVPPPQLVPYLGQGEATNKECEVAYHNVFMVMLWSSLAERKVNLMTHALQQMPAIPSGASWLTYARCHDDIGWAVTEEDAAAVELDGYLHRTFLSEFYNGRFPNTFARGASFQFNPKNNDQRISGSMASLAGLEAALEANDPRAIDLAIRRIVLLNAMIFTFGGIPLLYMGDEIGLLNDHSYLENPDLADDNRWMHRPPMDWEKAAKRTNASSVEGRIFQALVQLIHARKRLFPLHARAQANPVWTHNDHVFGLIRESARGKILVLANFSEWGQAVSRRRLYELGFDGQMVDGINGRFLDAHSDIYLEPYQSMWLEKIT